MKKKAIILFLTSAMIMLYSCSGDGHEAQQETAVQEARQMEEKQLPDPITAGRQEAKKFIVKSYSDSLELHAMLLDTKALYSRYVQAGRKDDAVRFDTVFLSTLRTVNPHLYQQIKAGR